LRFQPLCRHRLWQLSVGYLALGKTGNLLRKNGYRPRQLFLIQPRRSRHVLRLYDCIGTQRSASGPEILWSMRQAASQASSFISPEPRLADKSPSSLDRAGGARGGRGEWSASGEENFTIPARIGAHY
jgi:hypothetical protein